MAILLKNIIDDSVNKKYNEAFVRKFLFESKQDNVPREFQKFLRECLTAGDELIEELNDSKKRLVLEVGYGQPQQPATPGKPNLASIIQKYRQPDVSGRFQTAVQGLKQRTQSNPQLAQRVQQISAPKPAPTQQPAAGIPTAQPKPQAQQPAAAPPPLRMAPATQPQAQQPPAVPAQQPAAGAQPAAQDKQEKEKKAGMISKVISGFFDKIKSSASAVKGAVEDPQMIDNAIKKLTPQLPQNSKGLLDSVKQLVEKNPGYTNVAIGILINVAKWASGGPVAGLPAAAITGMVLRTLVGVLKGEPVGTAAKKAAIVTGVSIGAGAIGKGVSSMLGGHGFGAGVKSYFGGGADKAASAAADVAGGAGKAAGGAAGQAVDTAGQAAAGAAEGTYMVNAQQMKSLFKDAIARSGGADLQDALMSKGIDPNTADRIVANAAKLLGTDQDTLEQNIKHTTSWISNAQKQGQAAQQIEQQWKELVDAINGAGGLPQNVISKLGAGAAK